MPTKSKNARSTRRVGKSPRSRKAEHHALRQRREAKAVAPAILADAFHTLKLAPKKGVEVYFSLKGDNREHDAEKMYNDLYASFANIKKQIRGEDTRDLKQLGISYAQALRYILAEVEGMIPRGYAFNIDNDGRSYRHDEIADSGKYYFTFFYECNWDPGWIYMCIGRACRKMRRNTPKLLRLFLSFIKLVYFKLGVPTWHSAYMGGTLDYIEDRAYQLELEGYEVDDPDMGSLIAYKKVLDKYHKGIGYEYGQSILHAPDLTTDQIRKELNKYKAKPIVEVISSGCDLIDEGLSINDFSYIGDTEIMEGSYLKLDGQVSVIWDENDAFYYAHCDSIDAIANEGIQGPVFSECIYADTIIDFAKWDAQTEWPVKLQNYLIKANSLLNEYAK